MPVRYTVKQVSQLTGVSSDLLRAWERRYGIVAPARTPSRYRLYADADVARLRRMAELVAAGAPASLAARQVLAEVPSDTAPGSSPGAGPSARWAPQEPAGSALPPVEALADAARRLDGAGLERTLDAAFSAGSFEAVFDAWVTPALVHLGQAWEAGEVSVAGEHFVSAGVHRRLSQAFEAAGTAQGAPVVAVGLPPAALHELAALAFATCLRRRGVDVRYLGADLPVDSWVAAVGRLEPAAVALSVPTPTDAPAGDDVLGALARAGGSLAVFAGGHGCDRRRADRPATLLAGPVTAGAHELALRLAA